MSRIGEPRPAATPTSTRQRARRDRILRVASRLAAEREFELVQMNDVAAEARVAIGTLYRYFPSKAQLFVGAMADQIDRLGDQLAALPAADAPPDDAVFHVLAAATRNFLRRPTLAGAMIQSLNNAHQEAASEVAQVDDRLYEILLRATGIDEPTEDDRALIRLVVQLWYGVLQSCLNTRMTLEEGEQDLRRACSLLLAPMVPTVRPAAAATG